MVPKKHITTIPVQLVTIEGDRQISDVIARLDEEINKIGSSAIRQYFQGGRTREELVQKFRETIGESDFLYFMSLNHGSWLNKYFDTDTYRIAFMYTCGNPFIAAEVMKHDMYAGLNLPLRLFIIEKEDRSGTKIVYHLPSSLVAPGVDDDELKMVVEELDAKVETLVLKILSKHCL